MTRRSQLLLGLVSVCTGLNLVLGLAALLAASQGHPRWAAWCLLASVISDAADGFLARLWGVASSFGAQLDSLADMTSFVIAGSVITFFWFRPGLPLVSIGAAASLYAFMGACRLARFNSGAKIVDEFQGLPTTAMAALVASTYLTYPELSCRLGLWLVVTLSLLMVSHYPYPKWSRVAQYPRWLLGGILLAGLIFFKPTVWACSAAYIASGPAIWLKRKLTL